MKNAQTLKYKGPLALDLKGEHRLFTSLLQSLQVQVDSSPILQHEDHCHHPRSRRL